MAEEPNLKIDPETRKRLEDLDADIKKARKSLETMRKMGMDVKPLEDKLSWSEEARKTILEEFE